MPDAMEYRAIRMVNIMPEDLSLGRACFLCDGCYRMTNWTRTHFLDKNKEEKEKEKKKTELKAIKDEEDRSDEG